jgi:saccharopine dehydrogenase-like NADP-dependent oxidoreductase
MKKVIIIGAGAQANVIAGVLSKADDVSEIVVTDINQNRAQELVEVNGSSKLTAEKIDASQVAEMASRMKQDTFDLVVNATIPRFTRQVLQAAFEAKTNYLDMASNELYPKPDIPIEQMEYAEEWEKAGLKCLTGAGGDPGLSNIMAKDAVLDLEKIDSIKIKDYGIVESEKPIPLWSMRTYLEDCADNSWIWDKGKPKEVGPFTGEECYYFPAPLEVAGTVYYHAHEESVTIPLYCGKPVEYCDFKLGEPAIDTWKFLILGMGLMDKEAEDFDGCKVSPRDMMFRKVPDTPTPKEQIKLYDSGELQSKLMLTCDVEGTGKNGRRTFKLWTNSPDGAKACKWIPGSNDVSWMTSIPASIFSLMMLREQVDHVGIFPPEVFTREEINEFYRGIKEWGIYVTKREEHIIE